MQSLPNSIRNRTALARALALAYLLLLPAGLFGHQCGAAVHEHADPQLAYHAGAAASGADFCPACHLQQHPVAGGAPATPVPGDPPGLLLPTPAEASACRLRPAEHSGRGPPALS
jgi:hypothetical protein